ncbi:LOW QUALITY PROTEIN: calpain-9-like [Haliotis rubra]|uniref:LOW QUALITY PROTEIN: calpain-9-like n=1 Tax=Haliotis rubra TaxID=36100 RepID=UPI001EE5949F|nr:LOW QUALITY PROTEIN: calpain-9-like [Haliotis rubra]
MEFNPNRRYTKPEDYTGHPTPPYNQQPHPQNGSPGVRTYPTETREMHHRNGDNRDISEFDRLRQQCLRNRKLYEDSNFLAAVSSLYYSRQPPYRFDWKRPGDIARIYNARPGFFVNDISRFDVKQGTLGDCWVLAAIACLSSPEHRERFFRVVPDDQSFHDSWYAGLFHFFFWHFGEWKEVVVDDQLPVVGRELFFVHSSQPNEFWAALLEKAYAKLYGSYEALKGGSMADSLTDFTGGLTESYTIRGKHANMPRNIINILFKALDRNALIGCGIDPVKSGSREAVLENGLVAGHAYSVTDLREIQMMTDRGQIPVTLIRVRNPWGNKIEWNGRWSDRSQEWLSIPDREREQIGLVQRDNGEFWMDFQDFERNFDNLEICNLTLDDDLSHVVEHHGRWIKGFNAGGIPSNRDTFWTNPQYHVGLQDTDDDDDSHCSFIVQVMQKDRRKIKNKGPRFLFLGFVIYRCSRDDPIPLNKDFFDYNNPYARCNAFSNTRQVVKRFAFPPGDYVVMPCTYEPHQEVDYYVRFFFEKGNVAEYSDEKPAKITIPPPEPSAGYKEQEEKFKQFFYKAAGEDMEVNPFELKIAINDALKKEPLHREIGIDACKSFVSLMDVDNSGRLGINELSYLWNHLRSWKKVFYQYDANKSGTMNSYELQRALPAAGYKVSHKTMVAIIFRYGNENNGIELDNFLILLARLMKLFNIYSKHEANGHAEFTLQQLLEQSLYS